MANAKHFNIFANIRRFVMYLMLLFINEDIFYERMTSADSLTIF